MPGENSQHNTGARNRNRNLEKMIEIKKSWIEPGIYTARKSEHETVCFETVDGRFGRYYTEYYYGRDLHLCSDKFNAAEENQIRTQIRERHPECVELQKAAPAPNMRLDPFWRFA